MRFAGPFSSRFRNAKRVSLLVFAPNGAVLGANWGELHRIADPVCHGAALVQWVCRAIGRSAVPCTVRDGGREDLQWSVISPAQKWLGLLGLGLPHPPQKKTLKWGYHDWYHRILLLIYQNDSDMVDAIIPTCFWSNICFYIPTYLLVRTPIIRCHIPIVLDMLPCTSLASMATQDFGQPYPPCLPFVGPYLTEFRKIPYDPRWQSSIPMLGDWKGQSIIERSPCVLVRLHHMLLHNCLFIPFSCINGETVCFSYVFLTVQCGTILIWVSLATLQAS